MCSAFTFRQYTYTQLMTVTGSDACGTPNCSKHFCFSSTNHRSSLFLFRTEMFEQSCKSNASSKHSRSCKFCTLRGLISYTHTYRAIRKSVKHFKNSQQINYSTDHGSSYADRERNFPSVFF